MEKCRTCKHFKRGVWDIKGSEKEYQLGGTCELLKHVLAVENVIFNFLDQIYIQDTFGCILHNK